MSLKSVATRPFCCLNKHICKTLLSVRIAATLISAPDFLTPLSLLSLNTNLYIMCVAKCIAFVESCSCAKQDLTIMTMV